MAHMGSEDPFVELKERHRDYKVFDGHYERIGKVDEIFVDEADHPIYLGVSMGLLESGSALIPMDIVRINDKRGVVEVDTSRNKIEGAPSLGSGDEISPEIEDRVRTHYGLKPLHSSSQRPDDAQAPATEDPLAFDERIDLIPGEREAAQERFEGDPPYRERSEQLLRNQEQETAQRESMEREAMEREAMEREAAEREAAEREAAEREAAEREAVMEREAAEREVAEREAAEREAAERNANPRNPAGARGTERQLGETGKRSDPAGTRVRRFSR